MILTNCKTFINGQFHNYDVEIKNGKISQIGESLSGKDCIDLHGKMLFPGFIDTHIHGAVQMNCGDSVEAMKTICKALPKFGVTSFTPTPIASSVESSVKAVRNIRGAKGCAGSDVLGIFLYTPYKNRSIDYYDDPVYPTKEHTLQLVDNDLSDIFSILYAPELDKDQSWTKWIVSQGILPVIGFSEGTYQDIHNAVANGATLTDHFYNGFPSLDHHFDVSTADCLLEDNLSLQMNCDTIHVAIPFLKLAIKIKGINHILPVSDSSAYVGVAEGEYEMDGMKIYVKNGSVRDKNGKLVTGAHSYDENMRTMYKSGFSLEEVGVMFSENAAEILKLKDRGKIEVDRRADFVVMDEQLNVVQTYIEGKLLYKRDE